jgi:hypothetical protein
MFVTGEDVEPVIEQLRLLGFNKKDIQVYLWHAVKETGLDFGFPRDEVRNLVDLHFLKTAPLNSRVVTEYSRTLFVYKELVLYPLKHGLSLLRQAWLEISLASFLGIRSGYRNLLFEGMAQQLMSVSQLPYFEILLVLFGPAGNNFIPEVYPVEAVEDYFRQIELGRMGFPATRPEFALGLVKHFQVQGSFNDSWTEQLIPVLEDSIARLNGRYSAIVRSRFGLGQPKLKIDAIAEGFGFSRGTIEVQLNRVYRKLRHMRPIHLLVPKLCLQ